MHGDGRVCALKTSPVHIALVEDPCDTQVTIKSHPEHVSVVTSEYLHLTTTPPSDSNHIALVEDPCDTQVTKKKAFKINPHQKF